MKVFNVDQGRCESVDLFPIESHVNENNLRQVAVDQLIDVFAFEEIFWDSAEFVACKSDDSQVNQLLNDFKILVP